MNYREDLAALCHEQWSGWMEYLFSKCIDKYYNHKTMKPDITIPKWAVDKWRQQMRTAYKDLREEEKESNRKEVDRFIKLFE